LGLYRNQLTGPIPSEIGNLTNLSKLKLEYNQLTGSIPSAIGNLTSLTYLDLGRNALSGVIPESICDLNIDWSNNNLFNIRYNQLSPPYPSCIEDYVGKQDTSDYFNMSKKEKIVLKTGIDKYDCFGFIRNLDIDNNIYKRKLGASNDTRELVCKIELKRKDGFEYYLNDKYEVVEKEVEKD